MVSLATGKARFAAGLERLSRSLEQVGFDGIFAAWSDRFPRGCPTHFEVPFAFKPYCLVAAREAGAELVLWLDSSCVAVRPLDRLFAELDRSGYLLFRNGRWAVGEWASDEALRRLGVTRDEAMAIPELNAAAIGLDLRNPTADAFLDRWYEEAQHGTAFRGVEEPLAGRGDYEAVKANRHRRVSDDPRVRGHRHDQTVAGVLAHRLGMQPTTVGLEVAMRRRRVFAAETSIVNLRGRSVRRLLRRLWRRPRTRFNMKP